MIIIGKTASGKSTIADLMLRLFDPTKGSISIGGQDIKQMEINELRHAIGYVPQDIFLFSDTVSNNIRFADHSANDQKVYDFADHASVKKDILNLPEQFDTKVGERGVTLSGGQKQRVSIARALIKDPDIFILDDCLSAVDLATEKHILSYFKDALRDKTAIIITHRIFTTLEVDKVLVLEDGNILEYGSPQELMKQQGYYHQLVTDELKENQVKTA